MPFLPKMLEKTNAITNIVSKGFSTVHRMPSTERRYWFFTFLTTSEERVINPFLHLSQALLKASFARLLFLKESIYNIVSLIRR